MGRRNAANDNLNTIIENDPVGKDIQIVFIQEPCKAGISGGKVYKAEIKWVRSRAAIYINHNFKRAGCCHMITELTNGDQVAVDTIFRLPNGGKLNVVLCSIYMPSDANNNSMITSSMEKLTNFCKEKGRELIIAMDSNSHAEQWGSPRNNSRGERLMDWINQKKLVILNKGDKNTFVKDPLNPQTNCSIIDITLATPKIAEQINKWQVLDED